MKSSEVRPLGSGVFLISRAGVNCYLIVADDQIVLIDAGLPRMWPQLVSTLASVGATVDDIDVVLLTHGHFDHVGMGERLMLEHSVPVQVHARDRRLAQHPYRYDRERPRWRYPFEHPAAIPLLGRMVLAGALGIKGVEATEDIDLERTLPVAGGLRPVFCPGHTYGLTAFLLEKQGILFSGDALVTLDPYTGQRGPRLVARAATADAHAAADALDTLADTGAATVLSGHGEPWTRGVRSAAADARRADQA